MPSRHWARPKTSCIAAGRIWARRPLHQAPNEIPQVCLEPVEVALQGGEACRLLEVGFIHVELAVDFYLQAVTALGRLADPGHQRHPLEGVVAGHTVATLREEVFDDA